MSRLGTVLRLLVCAMVFAVLVGPQWLSLRFGRGRVAAHLPTWFHRVFLYLFSVRVSQSGRPPEIGEPALVLANHVSWLDILVLGSLRPLSFVAKSEIEGWPVVGLLARLQRTVFIDRARRAATADVNATLAVRLAAGDLIVLFAEGTTNDGTRLLPFKSSLVGAARAAIDSRTDGHSHIRLQPLAIAYPRRNGMPVTRGERPDIAWYGDMELAPHLSVFLSGGPIDVQVIWGEPIPFESGTDRKRATAMAEASVRTALQQVHHGRPKSIGRDQRRGGTSGDAADLDAADLPASGLSTI